MSCDPGGFPKSPRNPPAIHSRFCASAASSLFRSPVVNLPLFAHRARLNIELASLANAILAYQKKPLTQVELYAALQAAGAELPRDPEAFRLRLHRAKKQGLVTKLRGSRSKA
jgi:hypothetical protein